MTDEGLAVPPAPYWSGKQLTPLPCVAKLQADHNSVD